MEIFGLDKSPLISSFHFGPIQELKSPPTDATDKTPDPDSSAADPSSAPDDKSAETEKPVEGLPETIKQRIARVMAELFEQAGGTTDDIFHRMRQMRNETMAAFANPPDKIETRKEKNKHRIEKDSLSGRDIGQPASAESVDSPPPAAPPPVHDSFSIDLSVDSVFERMEKLVQRVSEQQGRKIFKSASSVLRRQSAGLHLDFSFTTQLLDRGINLAEIDQSLVQPFMDAAAGLSNFDDNSLQKFMTSVENMFNGLENKLGLQDGTLQANEDLFKKTAKRFFDSVQEIVNAPSVLDDASRRDVLDLPPESEFFRKSVADIFRAAGGMDIAKRVVAGQPSDLDILLEKLKKDRPEAQKKETANAPTSATDHPSAPDAGSSGDEPQAVRLARENMIAISNGFTAHSIFEAARFFNVFSDSGAPPSGTVHDAVA